jgi:hypothetical protein
VKPTASSKRSALLAYLPPDLLLAVRACLDGMPQGYCARAHGYVMPPEVRP